MSNPRAADLAAIESEWPLIAAELEVTDAECRLAAAPGDVLAARAYRRAVRRALVVLAQRSCPPPAPVSGSPDAA